MRNAFADEILHLAKEDSRVVLLSADIGNRLFDKFKIAYPGRFYNCGVAEANMVSMAAGMASSGLRPVCYTITPFVTTRCLEQIKVDVCYHHMPVVIVGTGSGLSYASLGATHHSFEDIAIMRVLPGMNVFAPGDANELRSCITAALGSDQPCYIRIGKKGEPVIYKGRSSFHAGQWSEVKPGSRVALLAAGTMLPVALEAATKLDAANIATAVVGCASIKPLDTTFLSRAVHQFEVLATVEEHSIVGGFGSSVSDWLTAYGARNPRLLVFGIRDEFMHEAGDQDHARKLFGIDATSIAKAIERVFN